MKAMNVRGSVLDLMAVLTFGGFASMDSPFNVPNAGAVSPANAYLEYGAVQSIGLLKQDDGGIGGSGVGLGANAGAVVAGVVGHQVGSDGATRRRPSSARPAVPMWATNWKAEMSRSQTRTRSLSAWRTGHIKL